MRGKLFSQNFSKNLFKRPNFSNNKLCETQIEDMIWWHWHVARIISSQKIYGLHGLKHHIVEMRGGVTDAGQQTTERTVKIELLSQWKLEAEFRNLISAWTQTRPMDWILWSSAAFVQCPLELLQAVLGFLYDLILPKKVPLWVLLSYEGNICELTISSTSKNLGRWWCDGQDRAKVGKKTRENG